MSQWSIDSVLPARTATRVGRTGTLDDVVGAIADQSRIYIGYGCAAPVAIIDALTDKRERWTRLEIVTGLQIDPLSLFDHPGAPFHLLAIQASASMRPMFEAGAAHVVPSSLSQWADLCSPGGALPCDIAVVQVSEPGPEGRFSLGVGGADQIELVRRAPLVIAEVNSRMPYTFGASELDRNEIDLLVEVEHELPEIAPPTIGATEEAIAAITAVEIPDGATLQFGIGAIPTAIVAALKNHTDLGVHSGMIGDACIDIAEAGVITGARKTLDPGLIVSGVVIGSRRCFDWVDRNPAVLIAPSAYSHGPQTLARCSNLAAINSAIEVSLDGEANAENIGTRIVSGPGGQPDFALGASLAPGGVGILALPSTAARGSASRIVRRLDEQVPVTTPRWLADRVITEHGVARLRGVPVGERAERLRAIADPSFRDDLV